MNKNIIIAVLVVIAIITFISTCRMSNRASYWMGRCNAAEAVIEQVREDKPDYVLDVLCEGDNWDEWNIWLEYNPCF